MMGASFLKKWFQHGPQVTPVITPTGSATVTQLMCYIGFRDTGARRQSQKMPPAFELGVVVQPIILAMTKGPAVPITLAPPLHPGICPQPDSSFQFDWWQGETMEGND